MSMRGGNGLRPKREHERCSIYDNMATVKAASNGVRAMREGPTKRTRYEIPSPASSFRISASVSIFLSCVASSRSPFFCFSLSSSIALSYGTTEVSLTSARIAADDIPCCSGSEPSWR